MFPVDKLSYLLFNLSCLTLYKQPRGVYFFLLKPSVYKDTEST